MLTKSTTEYKTKYSI